MKNTNVWIKIEDSKKLEGVQDFILSLSEEDLLGEIEVTLYAEKERAKCRLSHIYDVSEEAIPVLKEKYGDKNVKVVDSRDNSLEVVLNEPAPTTIDRIADALESISRSLESIDQSLEDATEILMDCQVKNQYGSAIAVTGTIQQI